MYCVATTLHFYFIDISENFRRISVEKNYSSRNLAENYKYKIWLIGISAVFFVQLDLFFSNSARKSSPTGRPVYIPVVFDR